MNIAIIIPELGGGGAEKAAQKIGNHYIEQGNHVYYFLLDTHQRRVLSVEGEIINTGLASAVTDVSYGFKEVIFRLLTNAVKIRRLKRQYKIDVSISFMEECNYLNILSQKGEKVIVRICTILSQRDDLNQYLYNKKIVRFFYSLPCRIVVMSRYARNDMIKNYHIKKEKTALIPNASDKTMHEENENSLFGDRCIITIGRLDPVKQHDRLLRVFSYIAAVVADAELMIVGTGVNERYLKGMCRKYGIEEKVHFLGFQKNVAKYLSMAKVFVMSSVVEGFPNSMIEAMACGIPVVSTDSPGGCRDIIGKKIKENGYWLCRYGILTPKLPKINMQENKGLVKEEQILGQAVIDILNNENLRKEYSAAAKARAYMYREDKVYERWDRIVMR